MPIRKIPVVAAVLLLALTTFGITTQTGATTAKHSSPGVLGTSTGSNWADKLTFTDPNVTATFSVTNTSFKAGMNWNTCMTTDSCQLWGVDDASGNSCSNGSYIETDCDDETSLTNSILAFTPTSVGFTEGVTFGWNTSRCGNIASDYPTPSNPIVNCPNVAVVTIQFSEPVSNAVIHINNIGGNAYYPSFRNTNFRTGFDMTLFSKWKLTTGQTMVMLSGSETTNIMLDGNVIRNRFTPQGVGARVSTRECGYDEFSCQYDNGVGLGSFLVLGTYSTLTFNIDLGWALVNYGPDNPANTVQGSFDVPEGVSVQMTFYKEGPALPTTTVPSTATSPTTTRAGAVDAELNELPATGSTTPLLIAVLAVCILGLGSLIRMRMRT